MNMVFNRSSLFTDYDAILIAVNHDEYMNYDEAKLKKWWILMGLFLTKGTFKKKDKDTKIP